MGDDLKLENLKLRQALQEVADMCANLSDGDHRFQMIYDRAQRALKDV